MRTSMIITLTAFLFISIGMRNGKCHAQTVPGGLFMEKEQKKTTVENFTATKAEEELYFKLLLSRLKENCHLVLERKGKDSDRFKAIDTIEGVGIDIDKPILYCMKDEQPLRGQQFTYRVRKVTFKKSGEMVSEVLIEKKFNSPLLSME